MLYFYSFLTETIIDSFQTGNFSNELKLAEVMPVYKKRNPLNKENYRPVRVLSHVSKIFEKVIYEQINSYRNLGFLIYCADSEKIIIANTPC